MVETSERSHAVHMYLVKDSSAHSSEVVYSELLRSSAAVVGHIVLMYVVVQPACGLCGVPSPCIGLFLVDCHVYLLALHVATVGFCLVEPFLPLTQLCLSVCVRPVTSHLLTLCCIQLLVPSLSPPLSLLSVCSPDCVPLPQL